MAAAADHLAPQVVDLTRIKLQDLEPLLDEERLAWRSTLSWEFSSSLELVRRFVRMHALGGYALRAGNAIVGYAYHVIDERKGLIGDLFLSREYDNTANSNLLLEAMLSAMIRTPGVQRIEGQIMLAHGPTERVTPFQKFSQVYPRTFMLADVDDLASLPPVEGGAWRLMEWDPARQDDAATVIAAAYQGHVDSNINDQYRSWAGARRFLHNVTHNPGSGHFFSPASKLAVDRNDRVVGVLLASSVGTDTGHITQVCVMPEAKGTGAGYELIRNAAITMRHSGCERCSLTVTVSNTGAAQLYQRMGFRAVRRFGAYVWEGF